MENLTATLLALLPSILAIIAVYVNLTTEVTKVKSRLYALESDRDELKVLVKECIEGIQELKLLLAKQGKL